MSGVLIVDRVTQRLEAGVRGDHRAILLRRVVFERRLVRGVWLPRAQLDRMLEDLRPTADPEP